MPATGMMPMVMPMFSNAWNASMAQHADADQRPGQVAGRDRRSPERQTTNRNRASSSAEPAKPNCSATAVKMKSVDWLGT